MGRGGNLLYQGDKLIVTEVDNPMKAAEVFSQAFIGQLLKNEGVDLWHPALDTKQMFASENPAFSSIFEGQLTSYNPRKRRSLNNNPELQYWSGNSQIYFNLDKLPDWMSPENIKPRSIIYGAHFHAPGGGLNPQRFLTTLLKDVDKRQTAFKIHSWNVVRKKDIYVNAFSDFPDASTLSGSFRAVDLLAVERAFDYKGQWYFYDLPERESTAILVYTSGAVIDRKAFVLGWKLN